MSIRPAQKPVAHTTAKGKEMTDDDIKLSPHFSLSELCTTNKKLYKDKNLEYGKTIKTRLETLAYFLEDVRKVCDCPLLITSGARCPELNAAVGGAKTSQHVTGHAADFIPQGKETIQTVFCKIYDSHLIYDQLILEESGGKIWIHISYNSMSGRREALVFDGKRYKKYTG